MMAHDIVKVIMRLIESIFCVLYFAHPLPARETTRASVCVAVYALLSYLVLVWPENFWPYATIPLALVRFFIYAMLAFLYLFAVKKGSWKTHLYFSILLTILHTIITDLFMISPFADFRMERIAFFPVPVINVFFVYLVQILISWGIFWLIRRECDFRSDRSCESLFLGFYVFLALILVYMKQSMKDRQDNQLILGPLDELSIYYFALLIMALLVILMIERFARTEKNRRDLQTAISLQNYRYHALLEREKLEEKILCLQHDMKHHLLAIKNMNHDSEQINAYIDGLQQQIDENKVLVETGNPIINGLMAEKLAEARNHHIHININMDLRETGFIKEVDLCTLVSNALDNAIEASLRVPDQSLRRIHIKAGIFSGFLVFRVMNYFDHELLPYDGRFITSKKDKKHHGLGLLSLRYVAEKYDGQLSTEVDENHYFILKILIPAKC